MDEQTILWAYIMYSMSGTDSAKSSAFRFKIRQFLMNSGYQALLHYQQQNPQAKFLRDDNPIEDVDLTQYSPSDIL